MIEIIQKYNIKAKKSLGQNFLIHEETLDNIALLTEIYWENIIEVWPWFGVLTEKILYKNPLSLTLIELDRDMINIINTRIEKNEIDITQTSHFQIINQDILKTEIKYDNYKVIANIPYYITSPILFRFLYELENKPTTMIILIQKEVWEKIISSKSSFLSLYITKKSKATLEISVPKNYFYPAPKVDSVVLKFELIDNYNHIDDDIFLSFIKDAFSAPRKKLVNNLSKYDKTKILNILLKMWYNENTRAEELNLDNYINMLKIITEKY